MQEGGNMKLEAMNISFQYDNGNRKILNNVSISLESGERVGLTAPSGFGKTTFCKILAGYEKPEDNRIFCHYFTTPFCHLRTRRLIKSSTFVTIVKIKQMTNSAANILS